MHDTPDAELLERFARNDSEQAFAELVSRHIALVHSVAARHTENPQHAQEITQAVFIILSRKAASLGRKTVLSGWLYHTARLTAANFRRAESRRISREQEAYMQSTLSESSPDSIWLELAPHLDDAMEKLGATDRDAVVLRYFENKSLAEVGTALGMEERAAQKRVNRALEKLRTIFSKRGVTLTATLIASAMAANSVQAAPVGLAAAITATAAKGTLISATITALVKGTMKTLTWLKIKFAASLGVPIFAVAGVAAFTISASDGNRVSVFDSRPLSPVEYLKAFTQMPVIISNLVFSDEKRAGGITTNTYFLARLQPDGVFLREARIIEELQSYSYYPHKRLEGNYQTNYWYYGATGIGLYLWTDKNDMPKDKRNGAYNVRRYAEDIMSPVLNFGVVNVKVGSLIWSGNNFTAQSDMSGAKFTGSLIVSNDIPRGLQYVLERENKKYNYKVTYAYEKQLSVPLPSRISVQAEKEGKWFPIHNLEIFSLDIQESPLPEIFFDWRKYYDRTTMLVFLQTRDGVIDKSTGKLLPSAKEGDINTTTGTLVPSATEIHSKLEMSANKYVPSNSEPPHSQSPKKHGRITFFLILVAMAVVSIFIYRLKRN
ncbi:MAG: sigma-70 family RNA polymerase sigma factor [Verrucomicrobia bacterium]|jgi:RNA polymerase sigma factor (sigma-70 family)|nr:MAG: sigma-70 family RNA polymerase sigma factor [Verrucomicrobiota bacterium]